VSARSPRLVLIRHGHALGNGGSGYPAVLQGRTDSPLSSRGRLEVRSLLAHLRGGPAFTAIYSSPLHRAKDTAAPLSQQGLGSLHLCPALQEIDCGTLDGMPVDEVRRRFPELWARNLRQRDEDFRWPGGESYREFRERCLTILAELASRHSGRIAVVTHAGVISQVLGAVAGLSPARWEPFRPGHTAITELEWSARPAVVRFDDRSHLSHLRVA
jgi:alpha-ribazole phosphatase/probable phosphoglycerate mutase